MKKVGWRFIEFNFTTTFALLFLLSSPLKQAFAVSVPTGLGPIDATPEGLAGWFLTAALGVASGVAFLLILSGGIKYITAQGDPKAIGEAQKTITSAIVGFLVIFLSVLILTTIGGDKFLGIKGWDQFFK